MQLVRASTPRADYVVAVHLVAEPMPKAQARARLRELALRLANAGRLPPSPARARLRHLASAITRSLEPPPRPPGRPRGSYSTGPPEAEFQAIFERLVSAELARRQRPPSELGILWRWHEQAYPQISPSTFRRRWQATYATQRWSGVMAALAPADRRGISSETYF